MACEWAINAVRYGETDDIGFSMSHWKGKLRIEVYGGASGCPAVKRPDFDEESGRGTLIVDALAEDWGPSQGGTRTWCTISVPERVVAQKDTARQERAVRISRHFERARDWGAVEDAERLQQAEKHSR